MLDFPASKAKTICRGTRYALRLIKPVVDGNSERLASQSYRKDPYSLAGGIVIQLQGDAQITVFTYEET